VSGISKTINQPFIFLNKLNEYFVEVSVNVVVIDDIHEIHGIVAPTEEGVGVRVVSIYDGPGVHPHLESHIFTYKEGGVVNDSRLNDFLTLEDTPGHRVNVVLSHVQVLVTLLVDCLVSDHGVLCQEGNEGLNQFLRDEELIVGLLVNIASLRSPPILRVS